MRKLWRFSKAAILDVKQLCDCMHLRIDDFDIELPTRSGEDFGLRYGICQRFRRAHQVRLLVFVGFGDRKQHAAESWPSELVFWRKICPTEKRLSVGHQKSGQRPAALPGNCANRRLIARI